MSFPAQATDFDWEDFVAAEPSSISGSGAGAGTDSGTSGPPGASAQSKLAEDSFADLESLIPVKQIEPKPAPSLSLSHPTNVPVVPSPRTQLVPSSPPKIIEDDVFTDDLILGHHDTGTQQPAPATVPAADDDDLEWTTVTAPPPATEQGVEGDVQAQTVGLGAGNTLIFDAAPVYAAMASNDSESEEVTISQRFGMGVGDDPDWEDKFITDTAPEGTIAMAVAVSGGAGDTAHQGTSDPDDIFASSPKGEAPGVLDSMMAPLQSEQVNATQQAALPSESGFSSEGLVPQQSTGNASDFDWDASFVAPSNTLISEATANDAQDKIVFAEATAAEPAPSVAGSDWGDEFVTASPTETPVLESTKPDVAAESSVEVKADDWTFVAAQAAVTTTPAVVEAATTDPAPQSNALNETQASDWEDAFVTADSPTAATQIASDAVPPQTETVREEDVFAVFLAELPKPTDPQPTPSVLAVQPSTQALSQPQLTPSPKNLNPSSEQPASVPTSVITPSKPSKPSAPEPAPVATTPVQTNSGPTQAADPSSSNQPKSGWGWGWATSVLSTVQTAVTTVATQGLAPIVPKVIATSPGREKTQEKTEPDVRSPHKEGVNGTELQTAQDLTSSPTEGDESLFDADLFAAELDAVERAQHTHPVDEQSTKDMSQESAPVPPSSSPGTNVIQDQAFAFSNVFNQAVPAEVSKPAEPEVAKAPVPQVGSLFFPEPAQPVSLVVPLTAPVVTEDADFDWITEEYVEPTHSSEPNTGEGIQENAALHAAQEQPQPLPPSDSSETQPVQVTPADDWGDFVSDGKESTSDDHVASSNDATAPYAPTVPTQTGTDTAGAGVPSLPSDLADQASPVEPQVESTLRSTIVSNEEEWDEFIEAAPAPVEPEPTVIAHLQEDESTATSAQPVLAADSTEIDIAPVVNEVDADEPFAGTSVSETNDPLSLTESVQFAEAHTAAEDGSATNEVTLLDAAAVETQLTSEMANITDFASSDRTEQQPVPQPSVDTFEPQQNETVQEDKSHDVPQSTDAVSRPRMPEVVAVSAPEAAVVSVPEVPIEPVPDVITESTPVGEWSKLASLEVTASATAESNVESSVGLVSEPKEPSVAHSQSEEPAFTSSNKSFEATTFVASSDQAAISPAPSQGESRVAPVQPIRRQRLKTWIKNNLERILAFGKVQSSIVSSTAAAPHAPRSMAQVASVAISTLSSGKGNAALDKVAASLAAATNLVEKRRQQKLRRLELEQQQQQQRAASSAAAQSASAAALNRLSQVQQQQRMLEAEFATPVLSGMPVVADHAVTPPLSLKHAQSCGSEVEHYHSEELATLRLEITRLQAELDRVTAEKAQLMANFTEAVAAESAVAREKAQESAREIVRAAQEAAAAAVREATRASEAAAAREAAALAREAAANAREAALQESFEERSLAKARDLAAAQVDSQLQVERAKWLESEKGRIQALIAEKEASLKEAIAKAVAEVSENESKKRQALETSHAATVAELQSKIAQLEQMLQAAERSAQQARRDAEQSAELAASATQSAAEKFEAQLERAEQEVERAKTLMERANADLEHAKREADRYREELLAERSRREAAEKQQIEADKRSRDELERMQGQVASLTQQIIQGNEAIQKLRDQVTTARTESENVAASYKKLLADKEDELRAAAREIKEITHQLERSKEEVALKTTELKQKETEMKELADQARAAEQARFAEQLRAVSALERAQRLEEQGQEQLKNAERQAQLALSEAVTQAEARSKDALKEAERRATDAEARVAELERTRVLLEEQFQREAERVRELERSLAKAMESADKIRETAEREREEDRREREEARKERERSEMQMRTEFANELARVRALAIEETKAQHAEEVSVLEARVDEVERLLEAENAKHVEEIEVLTRKLTLAESRAEAAENEVAQAKAKAKQRAPLNVMLKRLMRRENCLQPEHLAHLDAIRTFMEEDQTLMKQFHHIKLMSSSPEEAYELISVLVGEFDRRYEEKSEIIEELYRAMQERAAITRVVYDELKDTRRKLKSVMTERDSSSLREGDLSEDIESLDERDFDSETDSDDEGTSGSRKRSSSSTRGKASSGASNQKLAASASREDSSRQELISRLLRNNQAQAAKKAAQNAAIAALASAKIAASVPEHREEETRRSRRQRDELGFEVGITNKMSHALRAAKLAEEAERAAERGARRFAPPVVQSPNPAVPQKTVKAKPSGPSLKDEAAKLLAAQEAARAADDLAISDEEGAVDVGDLNAIASEVEEDGDDVASEEELVESKVEPESMTSSKHLETSAPRSTTLSVLDSQDDARLDEPDARPASKSVTADIAVASELPVLTPSPSVEDIAAELPTEIVPRLVIPNALQEDIPDIDDDDGSWIEDIIARPPPPSKKRLPPTVM